MIEHPASSRGINDPALQFFRVAARQEHMQHRIVGAGLAGGIAHLLIAAAPAIANPHHHLLVRGCRRLWVGPVHDRPLDLGLPLQQANRLEFLLELQAEALLSLVGDFGGVVANRLALLLKQPLPLGTFCGLQAVFLQPLLFAHLHQGAVFCHRLQQAGDLIAQGAAVLAQIRHHQVGQGAGGGANALVGALLARQPADQEGQPAEALLELALFCALLAEIGDSVIEFVEQHARVHQVGPHRLEQHITGDHSAQVFFCDVFDSIKDDPQLRAQLAVGAGHINAAEALLPETPARGQQRVVGHRHLAVFAALFDQAAFQLLGHLTGVGLQHLLHVGLGIGAFLQDHLADHRFHVGVRQLHSDAEAVFEFL